jgi:outer membrane protein TolC
MHFNRVVCLFAFVLSTAALGETAPPPQRTITLEECVQLALQHNLDIQIQRYNPQIALFNLRSMYGSYNPSLSLGFSEGNSQQLPGYNPLYGSYPGATDQNENFSAGVSGLLPWGTSYEVGANLGNTDFASTLIVTNIVTDPVTGEPVSTNATAVPISRRQVSGNMGVLTLRQPLLQGFWIDGTRYNIALSKNSLKSSELGVRYQIMTTITSVESSYYTLIYSFDEVKVQEKAVELAEKLLAENKKRVEVGAMAPLDEKQAEAQLASSKADLLTAQRNLAVSQNSLKALLTDDYSHWHGTELRPATKLVAVPVSLDTRESWGRALAQRPDILQARLNLDRLGVALTYQKNQIYPRFDVVGRVGYSASSRNYDGALRQWGQGDAPFSSIGVEFSMPLGNQAARNSYKTAKAQREQEELRIKQMEQGVMMTIDNAITLVRTSLERVNATREARVYSQAAMDAEVKKLENGKSTNFEVLRLQRDLTSAMSAEIQALAAYNVALAQLAFAEGTTLERHKLDFTLK